MTSQELTQIPAFQPSVGMEVWPAVIEAIPTEWSHPQEVYDWLYLQIGRVTAQCLRKHPESLTQVRANILRWIKQTETNNREDVARILNNARREWLCILDTYSIEQIASLLEEKSHEGQRLRSSSPFCGEPFLNDAWLKPLYHEAELQINAAAVSYKRRIQSSRSLAK